MDSSTPRRRLMESSEPIPIINKPLSRPQSYNHRLSFSSRPVSSSWLWNSSPDDYFHSSFLHQPVNSSRYYPSSLRAMNSLVEPSYRSRMDRLYAPRYYLP